MYPSFSLAMDRTSGKIRHGPVHMQLVYYDPASNALVMIDGVTVWAYLYKTA